MVHKLITSHHQVGDRDPAQSGYWSVRESFVSYVLANMPMLYPLLKRLFERVGCSITLSSPRGASGRAASSGQAYRLGGYPRSRSKPRSKDPNPIPEETRYSSDEHIIFACAECSRTASSSQDTSRAEVDTKERHVHSPFQHGNNHTKIFRGPGHLKSKPSLSNAPATGGILVTKDIVVSEVHEAPGASGGGEAYFEV